MIWLTRISANLCALVGDLSSVLTCVFHNLLCLWLRYFNRPWSRSWMHGCNMSITIAFSALNQRSTVSCNMLSGSTTFKTDRHFPQVCFSFIQMLAPERATLVEWMRLIVHSADLVWLYIFFWGSVLVWLCSSYFSFLDEDRSYITRPGSSVSFHAVQTASWSECKTRIVSSSCLSTNKFNKEAERRKIYVMVFFVSGTLRYPFVLKTEWEFFYNGVDSSCCIEVSKSR